MFYKCFRDTMSDEDAIIEPKEQEEQEVGEEVSTSSFPSCKKKHLIQVKKTKFPVSSYYHIHGWGVILGSKSNQNIYFSQHIIKHRFIMFTMY